MVFYVLLFSTLRRSLLVDFGSGGFPWHCVIAQLQLEVSVAIFMPGTRCFVSFRFYLLIVKLYLQRSVKSRKPQLLYEFSVSDVEN